MSHLNRVLVPRTRTRSRLTIAPRRADRFYIAVNVTFRLMRPNWLPEPPVPNVYYVQPLLAAFVRTFLVTQVHLFVMLIRKTKRAQCMDFLTWTRRRLKVKRQNGYLFAPLQVQAALVSMKGVRALVFLPELIIIIDARDRRRRWRPGSPAMSLGSSLAGSSRRVSRKFRTSWWTWMKMGF